MNTRDAEPMLSQGPEGMRWCAGLPGVGKQALTAEQSTLARSMYRRSRNATVVYGGLALLIGAVSLALASLAMPWLAHSNIWSLTLGVLGFFLALPLCAAKAVHQGSIALPLRKDLARGVLWIFEGSIATARYEDEDPDLATLVEQGTLRRGAGVQRIGVLPSSARLVHVNGRDIDPKRKVHVATTAVSPESSLRYSLPPEVKQAFGGARGLKRRRLTGAERRELQAHVARLSNVPWTLFVLTGFTAVAVSLWIAHDRVNAQDVLGLGWVAAWVFVALRHIRRYLMARRIEDDLEVGWLLSWETPSGASQPPRARSISAEWRGEPISSAPESRGGALHGLRTPPFSVAEVLPISQLDWMIDDKPAPWRRVIQRARML